MNSWAAFSAGSKAAGWAFHCPHPAFGSAQNCPEVKIWPRICKAQREKKKNKKKAYAPFRQNSSGTSGWDFVMDFWMENNLHSEDGIKDGWVILVRKKILFYLMRYGFKISQVQGMDPGCCSEFRIWGQELWENPLGTGWHSGSTDESVIKNILGEWSELLHNPRNVQSQVGEAWSSLGWWELDGIWAPFQPKPSWNSIKNKKQSFLNGFLKIQSFLNDSLTKSFLNDSSGHNPS